MEKEKKINGWRITMLVPISRKPHYLLLIILVLLGCSTKEKDQELITSPLFVMTGAYIDCNAVDSLNYFAVFNLICCDTTVRINGDDDYPEIRMGDSNFVFSKVRYTNEEILKARIGDDFCYPSKVYKTKVRNVHSLGRNDFIDYVSFLLRNNKSVVVKGKQIDIDSVFQKTPLVFENGNYVSDW